MTYRDMMRSGDARRALDLAQGVHVQIAPKCRVVADSLEEVGDKLFTFTRFPPNQWKSIGTSNAIE